MNIRKERVMLLSVFLALAILPLFASAPRLPLGANPSVEKRQGSFGNPTLPEIATINWTRFWELFNAHSDWSLEYNDGSGWKDAKSDLQIIKNYQVFIDDAWVSVDKSEATNCKITLNFTASHTADYRLTFGVDLDVKNYTHKEGSWNYTITYQNYTVCFDWSDVSAIPNLTITHGIKPVGDESWFWFRIRKDGVQQGKNVVIDPNFGYETIGTSGASSIEDAIKGSVFTITESGTADSITVELKSTTSWTGKVKCAIYLHSNLSLVKATEERTVALTPTKTWFTFNFTVPKPSLTINTAYILVSWGQSATNTAFTDYDAGDTDQGHYQTITYNGFPNPLVPTHSDRKHSIYCSYTVSDPTHTLTISSSSGGTTDPSPGEHVYDSGTNVTVTAVPDEGYDLMQWVLDDVQMGNELEINVTMSQDHVLNALFDFNDWPMFHHGLARTGYTGESGPITNQTAWTFVAGGMISASPSVDDGVVYVGVLSGNDKFYALNSSTGEKIWEYQAETGIWSSAAVADGRVFFGDEGGDVYCLNTTSGSQIWRHIGSSSAVCSSPVVVGGVVYLTSENGYLYALNETSGSEIWNFPLGTYADSSPSVVDGVVYATSWQHIIYAVNATDGSEIWNYTTGESLIFTAPAVVEGVVYFGSFDGYLYALHTTDGSLVWKTNIGIVAFSSPAIAYGKVYVGTVYSKVFCLNATDGSEIWNYTVGGAVKSSPAINGETLYVGSSDNKVYALNLDTGALVWTYTTGNEIRSSPALANNMLYVGSNDGKVYAFGEASAEYFTVTFTHTGLDSSATGTVVTIDGTNYTYANLPEIFNWENGTEHTYAYADPVSSSTDGKRFSLINVTGPSSPFNVTEDVTITGNYHTQWQVTFTHTGLDGSANSTVVTVNGTAKSYADLPFTDWYNASDTITYSYSNVSSSTDGKRFNLTGVTGPTSPITVTSSETITGNYVVQWQVTFTHMGLDSSANSTVVTVNGTAKEYDDLPYVFWTDAGNVITYAYTNPVTSSTPGKQFNLTEVIGPASPITVTSKITVTGNYGDQRQLTFTHDGLDSSATGTVVTVNGTAKTYAQLPYILWVNYGDTITYSYTDPVSSSTDGKRFDLTSISGSASPINVTASETITGNYQVQWQVTFSHTGLDSSANSTVVTVNGTAKNYGDLPYSFWVNNGDTVTYSYTDPVSSSTTGKRFDWTSNTGPASPITVNAKTTVTGNYVVQWYVTVTHTGLDSSAKGLVVTVDGSQKTYNDLPFSKWVNHGDTLTYLFEYYVQSFTAFKKFRLASVTGPETPVTVTNVTTIIGNYVVLGGVTFKVEGLPSAPTTVVLTVDSFYYYFSDLPLTFFWQTGTNHTFAWISPQQIGEETYYWVATSGLSSKKTDVITVPEDGGEVVGIYALSTNTIIFDVQGLPANIPGWILQVDSTIITKGELPYSIVFATGSNHTYEFIENINYTGVTYYWDTCIGLYRERVKTFTMTGPGFVTGIYNTNATFWGESTVASSSEIGVATRYAKEWKDFFAQGRFWIMYSNGTRLYFQSAPYSDGQIRSWTSATDFGPPGVTVLTYDFVTYYEEARNFVHCAFIKSDQTGDPTGYGYFWYRRGQPKADGSIEWTTDWQQINNVAGDFTNLGHLYRVSLCTDSNGVPFLGFYGYRIPAGGDGIFVVKASSNNGTFTSPTATYFAATSTGWPINYPINIVLVPLTEGKVLAVYYYIYTGPTYYLKSRLWSGSAWGSAVNILPQSGSKLVYDDRAMAAASDLNQTVYLTYLNPDASEIYAFEYTLGVGWSGVQTVTDYTSTTSFPAVAFRDYVEIYWAYNDTIYGSRLDEDVWSEPFYVKILNADETYCDSINSFTREYTGKFGIAITYRVGTDYRIAMIYQPYVPGYVPPPQIFFPFAFFLWIVGVGMFIVGPTMMVRGIKRRKSEEIINGLVIWVIGFGLLAGALLG